MLDGVSQMAVGTLVMQSLFPVRIQPLTLCLSFPHRFFYAGIIPSAAADQPSENKRRTAFQNGDGIKDNGSRLKEERKFEGFDLLFSDDMAEFK